MTGYKPTENLSYLSGDDDRLQQYSQAMGRYWVLTMSFHDFLTAGTRGEHEQEYEHERGFLLVI